MKNVGRLVYKTDTSDNRNLVLNAIGDECRTINETIDSIFNHEIRTGKVRERTWQFYNHLNKLWSKLEKDGFVEVIGYKTGPTRRTEKVWRRIK